MKESSYLDPYQFREHVVQISDEDISKYNMFTYALIKSKCYFYGFIIVVIILGLFCLWTRYSK